MIAVVATLIVKPGAEGEFEAAAAKLAEAVRTHEAGCILYQFVRSRTEPGQYVALELYQTQEDLAAHGQSEHFKALSPALGATLAAKPAIAVHDVIA